MKQVTLGVGVLIASFAACQMAYAIGETNAIAQDNISFTDFAKNSSLIKHQNLITGSTGAVTAAAAKKATGSYVATLLLTFGVSALTRAALECYKAGAYDAIEEKSPTKKVAEPNSNKNWVFGKS